MQLRCGFVVITCLLLLLPAAQVQAQSQNYSDIWWDPSDPGWALTLADHEGQLSGVLYGYFIPGAGTWFLIPAGTFNEDKRLFAGDVYWIGGSPYNMPVNSNQAQIFRVGSMTLDFAPPDLPAGTALATFTMLGTTSTRQIQRYLFGDAAANWGSDHTDIWWSPARPDFGLAIAQHGDSVFGVWFTYDGLSDPRWYVFPSARFNGTNSVSTPVYVTRGLYNPKDAFDASGANMINVGNVALSFDGPQPTFAPTINGGKVEPIFTPFVDGSTTQWPLVPLQFGQGSIAVFCISPQIAPAPTIFSVSPIDLNAIRWIAPLGNLNPPGHPVPSDHIGFYFADPDERESPIDLRSEVVAPGSGAVTAMYQSSPPDSKIAVAVTPDITYYLDHIIPDIPITIGTVLTAGQHIGTTGTAYGIDLGVINKNVSHNFANPARYTADETLHGDGPIKYFGGSLQTQLYRKTLRLQPECDGSFNYDIPGTLSGNWYFSNWASLAFALNTYDPGQVRINVPYGMKTGIEGGVASIDPGDPPPSQVTPASGKVLYTLTSARTGLPAAGAPLGYLLVQMLDDTHVKAEQFGPSHTPPADFTSEAFVFSR